MENKTIDLGFIPQSYPEGTHICLIFKNEEERKEVVSRFLQKGIEKGEKVSYFAVKTRREELISLLNEVGVDTQYENLELSTTESTYYPTGKFVPELMLNKLKYFYDHSDKQGFPACRVSGEMDWATQNIKGSERIMEYESMVNIVLETHPVTAVCQYDARKFDQKTLAECLKVHPYMIVNGLVLENPFYITPYEYLKNK